MAAPPAKNKGGAGDAKAAAAPPAAAKEAPKEAPKKKKPKKPSKRSLVKVELSPAESEHLARLKRQAKGEFLEGELPQPVERRRERRRDEDEGEGDESAVASLDTAELQSEDAAPPVDDAGEDSADAKAKQAAEESANERRKAHQQKAHEEEMKKIKEAHVADAKKSLKDFKSLVAYRKYARKDPEAELSYKGSLEQIRDEDLVAKIKEVDQNVWVDQLSNLHTELDDADQSVDKLKEDLEARKRHNEMRRLFAQTFNHSMVWKTWRTARVTPSGKANTYSSLVVAGNRDGLIGFGIGRSPSAEQSEENAYKNVIKNAIFLPRSEGRTFPHEAVGTFNNCTVKVFPAARGVGIRASGPITMILYYAGITDGRVKAIGRRSPVNTVYALFNALAQMESREAVARRMGESVYRYLDPGDYKILKPTPEDYEKMYDRVSILVNTVHAKSFEMRERIRKDADHQAAASFGGMSSKEMLEKYFGKEREIPEDVTESDLEDDYEKFAAMEDSAKL